MSVGGGGVEPWQRRRSRRRTRWRRPSPVPAATCVTWRCGRCGRWTHAQTGEALVEVTRLAAQVAQLQLALLHQAEVVEVGADVGATSAASWLAHETRTVRAAVHRAARLARRLATAHPAVDIALADGDLTLDQAQVIVDAVDALPADLVDTDTLAGPRTSCSSEARHHDARALRVLGRRLLEVVDPEAADVEEARRLEQEEQAARASGVVHDVRRRPRAGPRQVHAALAPRLDPPQAPDGPRGARSQPRSSRPRPPPGTRSASPSWSTSRPGRPTRCPTAAGSRRRSWSR